MESDFTSSNILIAGLGLIGGSIAKALKKDGFENIYAYDKNAQTLTSAKQEGIIKAGYAQLTGDAPTFDLVVCCLSPSYVAGLYEDVKSLLKKGGVFAEVGGIKTVIIDHLELAMNCKHELLSLHPMAGNENSGYAYSTSTMFQDSQLIITPSDKTGDTANAWAQKLKDAMGCADIKQLSPKAHDQIIAQASHLPHVAALAIKAMDKAGIMGDYAGGSYKAITRVAHINSALWAGLMSDNREFLLQSIAQFKQNVDMLSTAIEKDDKVALKKLLDDMSK